MPNVNMPQGDGVNSTSPKPPSAIDSFLHRFGVGDASKSAPQQPPGDANDFASRLGGAGSVPSMDPGKASGSMTGAGVTQGPNSPVQENTQAQPQAPWEQTPSQNVPMQVNHGIDLASSQGAGSSDSININVPPSIQEPVAPLSAEPPFFAKGTGNSAGVPFGGPGSSPKGSAVIAALTNAKDTLEETAEILKGAIDDLKGAEDNIGAALGVNNPAPVTPKEPVGSGSS